MMLVANLEDHQQSALRTRTRQLYLLCRSKLAAQDGAGIGDSICVLHPRYRGKHRIA